MWEDRIHKGSWQSQTTLRFFFQMWAGYVQCLLQKKGEHRPLAGADALERDFLSPQFI